MANIPLLTAEDVECRIQSVNKGKSGKVGAILLIYKNARVDMRILDEVYGADNWQRTHEVINGNLFCNIDIWDGEKKCWVRKQDVGRESNTEAEKGEASDAFKRAGFCVGIGRELYTAPFIWIELKDGEYSEDEKTRKPKAYQTLKFRVTEIGYDDKRRINQLIICDSKGNARFTMTARHPISAGLSGKPKAAPKAKPTPADKVFVCVDCEAVITENNTLKAKNGKHVPVKTHLDEVLGRWGVVVCEKCAGKRFAEADKEAEELAQDLKRMYATLPPLPEPYDEDVPPEQIPLPFKDGTAVYCADCGKEIKVKDIEAHVNKCLNKWGAVVCGECAKTRLHVEELKREKVNKETA